MRAPTHVPHRLGSQSAARKGAARPADGVSHAESRAWALLRALATATRVQPITTAVGLELGVGNRVQHTALAEAWIVAQPSSQRGWSSERELEALEPGAARLLDLYMPLCVGPRSAQLTLAHLGQSTDGHVATLSSASKFITGNEDILHTHRLRALFDAVLVGADTVAIDNPMLTTRLVPGNSPVRVILDPTARLATHHTVFNDRAARTLVVVAAPARTNWPHHVETLVMATTKAGFDLRELLARLRELGLHRIFIEGGGVTVARFVQAALLDRLQLAIAPVTLGPTSSPRATELSPEWLCRHATHTRRFTLGADLLLDAALSVAP